VLLAKTLQSATFRRALIWIVIFGAIVLSLFGYAYQATRTYVLDRSDREIAAQRELLHRALDRGGRAALVSAIQHGIADASLDNAVFLLADAAFVPVAGNLESWPTETADGSETFVARVHATPDQLVRATFETLPDGSHLLVGRNISDLNEFRTKIDFAFALVIALICVIAGAASVSISRGTVGRIEAINAASRAIMQSGLGKRIPLRGTRNEWDQLAENLNSMLDRIEALMGEVKQVTDNVAHDLRTPLTRIRGRLERASNRERNSAYDRSLIEDTMSDLDAVLRMFSSITRIAQIETSDRTAWFRRIDLTELAGDVVELFDAAAEESGSRLKLVATQPVFVAGERELVFDALGNLVDNAIKHGRPAGRVTVEVLQNQAGAVVTVADDGPGIPADERTNVFKRFYRLERSRGTPGNGLGLSVVAAVARLHGARIEILDNAPGLKLQLRFPPAPVVDVDQKTSLLREPERDRTTPAAAE
jgi:signal transduction histidine kinase